jgi:MerR family redox-sensitive transcriptional activator SoxR
MEDLIIGEVAHRAGIRPSALRYYESVGLLSAPRRVNGRRRYDTGIFKTLAAIRFAQQAGFTIAEIVTLFQDCHADEPPAARWQAMARRKLEELDALIERAQQMKTKVTEGLDCRCTCLEECRLVAD